MSSFMGPAKGHGWNTHGTETHPVASSLELWGVASAVEGHSWYRRQWGVSHTMLATACPTQLCMTSMSDGNSWKVVISQTLQLITYFPRYGWGDITDSLQNGKQNGCGKRVFPKDQETCPFVGRSQTPTLVTRSHTSRCRQMCVTVNKGRKCFPKRSSFRDLIVTL